MKNLKAIDLFSGSGGTTQGIKNAGIDVIAAVEVDKVASKTYQYNNPEVALFNEDIRNITKESFSKLYDISKESILLIACPPCQGFSSIRHGGEDDSRNELVFEYSRLIKEINPEFLLMENVSGMTSKKGKIIFEKFKQQIEKNYTINYDVLNAANYGVPQLRKRLVLHGVRKDFMNKTNMRNVELPMKTHSDNEEDNLKPWNKADIILDLPPIKAGEEYKGKRLIYNHLANGLSEKNIERIRIIRKGGGSRSALPKNLVLDCHRGKKGHSDVYGLLDINKPSVTITGGCMTFSKGRFGHPTQDRALSAREAARLQSFEDDYVFFGNRGQLAKQIGNAVPVDLARASGEYFVKLMKGAESINV